jgi:hypothetical protein
MGESPSATLTELLDEHNGDSTLTTNRLTNHLPMALVAKDRLGADARELRRFADLYARRLTAQPSAEDQLSVRSWHTAIGQPGSTPALADYFSSAIRDNGVTDTLRSTLPRLVPGLAGAAFHGAIRLSYALDVASDSRVATGLAYMAESAKPLGSLGDEETATESLPSLFATLARDTRTRARINGQNITLRLQSAAANDSFTHAVAITAVTPQTFAELSQVALELFASTGDFTALHGVTGLAALEHLRTWIDDTEIFDRYCVQALGAAYVSIATPPLWSRERLSEFTAAHDVPREEVAAVGAASDDEHVAKIIYTSLTKYDDTANALYGAVAAREASLPVAR